MKANVACTLLPCLILALQASLCPASRQGTSKTLLQTTPAPAVPAGGTCKSGDVCRGLTQDNKPQTCPDDNTCPVIPAGKACDAGDICSGSEQTCPADPDTNAGTCPFLSAGDACSANDMCAISATAGASNCPTSSPFNCPHLPTNATCTGLAGLCSDDQDCNARLQDPTTNAIGLQEDQDVTPGVCITPIAAGSACKVGTDLCSGTSDFAGQYCSTSPCPLARPGVDCLNPDKCSDGSATGSSTCTPAATGETSQCPAVAPNEPCLAGDECTSPQVCNAVGTAEGVCVDPVAAGAGCQKAAASTAADQCIVTISTFGDLSQTGSPCTGTACPLASAGSPCRTDDKCSDGTTCPTTRDAVCRSIAAGGDCYANDICLAADTGPSSCNAQGTSRGKCTPLVAAGATCKANTDVCSPNGDLCTGTTCPVVPAGQDCQLKDACSSGTSTAGTCPAQGPCPSLATGLACSANDLCVRGAYCYIAKGATSGICEPNGKVPTSTPSPTPEATAAATSAPTPAPKGSVFSTASIVPTVNSNAVLYGYTHMTDFNDTEQTKFISTLEANILAKLNAVTNVTINKVTPGSVNVDNSIKFTGADSSAAMAGQSSLAALLADSSANGVGSIYGTSFGNVVVANVTQTNSTNPTLNSGAATTTMTWTLGIAAAIMALGATV